MQPLWVTRKQKTTFVGLHQLRGCLEGMTSPNSHTCLPYERGGIDLCKKVQRTPLINVSSTRGLNFPQTSRQPKQSSKLREEGSPTKTAKVQGWEEPGSVYEREMTRSEARRDGVCVRKREEKRREEGKGAWRESRGRETHTQHML